LYANVLYQEEKKIGGVLIKVGGPDAGQSFSARKLMIALWCSSIYGHWKSPRGMLF
jgi:hypothetical protein